MTPGGLNVPLLNMFMRHYTNALPMHVPYSWNAQKKKIKNIYIYIYIYIYIN